jgi:hypothetical protein
MFSSVKTNLLNIKHFPCVVIKKKKKYQSVIKGEIESLLKLAHFLREVGKQATPPFHPLPPIVLKIRVSAINVPTNPETVGVT